MLRVRKALPHYPLHATAKGLVPPSPSSRADHSPVARPLARATVRPTPIAPLATTAQQGYARRSYRPVKRVAEPTNALATPVSTGSAAIRLATLNARLATSRD